ncbi:MAG: Fic family protein, partial [Pseudomonadota bacterium]|nr:Fic family protein [Pseudomonadota bacterium]
LDIFFNWFNIASVRDEKIDGVIRAAIAHLWFEKIHPFDDGNGRIGRAIIDMALSQDEKLSTRFYSLSSIMMEQRKGYYNVLDTVSLGEMDVTVWVEWFLNCFINAIKTTMSNIEISIQKSRFWQLHAETPLNERQKKVLNKMLNEGVGGYVGGMTTRKYSGITKVSRATAYRELKDLIEKNCLQPLSEKGRSTSYEIVWPGVS